MKRKLEATIAGTKVAVEYQPKQHPKYKKLASAGDVRRLEVAAVVNMITRPEPLTGEEIRTTRRLLGFDQETFAELLGLARRTVIRHENGGDVPVATDFAIRFLAQVKLAAEGVVVDLKSVARSHAPRSPHGPHHAILKRASSNKAKAV